MFFVSSKPGRKTRPIVTVTGTPLAGYAWFPQPDDTPTLNQPGMDSFSPVVLDTAPNSSAPIISRITHKGAPGGCVWCTGSQFDDTMSLMVYSEVNGSGNFLAATMLYRSGNLALFRIHPSSVANSFMLAWLLHPTYGYSEPYAINAPEVFTLHGSFYGTSGVTTSGVGIVARVGDQIRVGGINLSSLQATQRCFFYFKKSGSAGTWAAATTAEQGVAICTLPSVANGTYDVWIHTGRGGIWGWHKSRRQLIVEAAQTLLADKAGPAPSEGDDKAAIQAVINTIGVGPGPLGNSAYVVLQPGTYNLYSGLNCQTGWAGVAHLKGAGIDSTILRVYGTGPASLTNGYIWYEDMTIDTSPAGAGGNVFSPDQILGGCSRLIRCKVINATGRYSIVGTNIRMCDGSYINCGSEGSTCTDLKGWMRDTIVEKKNGPEGAIFSVFGASNIAVDNVTVKDDPTNTGDGGRFYIRGVDCLGTSIANCTTDNLAVTNSDQNKGEQILFDGGYIREEYIASGGTTGTVILDLPTMIGGFAMRQTSTASSSNATSGTPTLAFPNSSTNGRFTHVKIISGTNTIPGIYPVASRSSNNVTLTGAIGTAASLSNVVAEAWYYPFEAKRTDIASSNANTSTPTISSSAFGQFGGSAGGLDVNRFIYFPNLGITRKITSVPTSTTAVLDGSISGSASISGETAYTFENYPQVGNLGLTVKGGKGVGQFAAVISQTYSGNTLVLTLDRVFRIPTDSTSYVQIWLGSIDTSIWNPTLSGNGAQASLPFGQPGASCAVESFSPNAGMYIWGGSITGLRHGIIDWAPGGAIISHQSCSIWNYAGDLTISNCAFGFRQWAYQPDYNQEISLSLSVVHNVDVSGTTLAGTWVEDWHGIANYCYDDVQISGNAKYGLWTYYNRNTTGNIIMNACSISIGSGTFSGSVGNSTSLTVSQSSPSSGQFVGFQS